MSRLLLIADACVIMDHGYIGGLQWLSQLGTVEVLDVVLAECLHARQPGLVDMVRAAGIIEVEAPDKYTLAAGKSTYRDLSPVDALLLYYAQGESRTLLTNERPLRDACTNENVEVHGTLWLVRQYFEQRLASQKELCAALDELVRQDRRTPVKFVTELRELLGCDKLA